MLAFWRARFAASGVTILGALRSILLGVLTIIGVVIALMISPVAIIGDGLFELLLPKPEELASEEATASQVGVSEGTD